MTRSSSTLLVLAVMACAACGSGNITDPAGPPTSGVVVVDATPTLPAKCRTDSIGDLLLSFTSQFGAEDVDPAAFLSPDDKFRWYADIQRPGGILAHEPDSPKLPEYFQDRREANDLLSLDEVRINNFDRRDNAVAIVFAGRRGARLSAESRMFGKGMINCADGKMLLWNMGAPGNGVRHSPFCAPTQRGRMVICSNV